MFCTILMYWVFLHYYVLYERNAIFNKRENEEIKNKKKYSQPLSSMLLEKLTQITIMGKWRITKLCSLAGSLNVRYLYFIPVRAAQYCWFFRCKINNANKTKMVQNVGAIYFLYFKKCTLTAAVASKENYFQCAKKNGQRWKVLLHPFPVHSTIGSSVQHNS